MPFTPGTSGNPKGRPKGSRNKLTRDMKERIQTIIDRIEPDLKKDLAQLTPAERVKTYIALLEYVTPKLGRMAQDVSMIEMADVPQFTWAKGVVEGE